MRLIDADRLSEAIHENVSALYEGAVCAKEDCLVEIEAAQTVDAVLVVRCRECQHWKPTGSKAGNSFSDMEYIGGCEFTKYCRRESDFCSYGERKEGADDVRKHHC